MIKFIIEKFRTAPGPLKQPRLILADIAEEVLDTALQYVNRRSHDHHDDGTRVYGAESTRSVEQDGRVEHGPEVQAESAPTGKVTGAVAPASPSRTLEVDPRLARATADAANVRKQDFKVLAILWDAYHRDLVPLSAKAVSDHGVQLGLAIRHENVRKVIRMRLEKYVDYHNEGAGSATIYRYALNAVGREYFDETYLRESER
jgi:hypothetical protein